jgi:hypothetical protein
MAAMIWFDLKFEYGPMIWFDLKFLNGRYDLIWNVKMAAMIWFDLKKHNDLAISIFPAFIYDHLLSWDPESNYYPRSAIDELSRK